jgi:hypothetical protein
MNLFKIVGRNGRMVTIQRDVISNAVQPDNKIELIKIFRDAFACDLTSALKFTNDMLTGMEKIKPTAQQVQERITDELKKIDNVNDLHDILRFVFTCIDHPKPIEQPKKKAQLGTFTENGDYIPR